LLRNYNHKCICVTDLLYSFYKILFYIRKMSEIKDKLKGVKDKVLGAGEDAKDTTTGAGQKDDPLTSYRDKEPMTPAKIKEHEPTAVKREMTERIAESGQTGTNPQEAAEIARKKGMAKGTAGAAETGSEYEQGSAGSNK
jgi:hypothetical protein